MILKELITNFLLFCINFQDIPSTDTYIIFVVQIIEKNEPKERKIKSCSMFY